jgi:3-hydroxyisobutyrate dehydrogenase
VVDSPSELSSRCDVIITVLFDAAAQRDVYLGDDGLLKSCGGRLFIDMSTVSPDAQLLLEAQVIQTGSAFVECPVGGTTGPARAGQLLGLAGGALEAVEQARPVLNKLCRRFEHVGPVGNGAMAKLAINLPLIVFWQSLGEALALARSLDKDPRWLVDLFADTAGAAQVLKAKSDAVVAALLGAPVDPTFDIGAMRKDLQTIVSLASWNGTAVPAASAVLSSLEAACNAGLAGLDCACLPAQWNSRPA